MKGKQQDFRTEKYIRYGIRKYSFGAASVAIAAGLMFLGNGAVSATEVQSAETAISAPTSSPDNKDNKEKIEPKAETVETVKPETVKPETVKPETVKPEAEKATEVKPEVKAEEAKKVNKAILEASIATLESKLSTAKYADATVVSSAKEVLAAAKATLAKADASQADVDAQAEAVSALSTVVTESNTAGFDKKQAAEKEAAKKVEAEKTATPVEKALTVATTTLTQVSSEAEVTNKLAQTELAKADVKKENKEAVTAAVAKNKAVLTETKALLADKSVTKEQVDAQLARLNESILAVYNELKNAGIGRDGKFAVNLEDAQTGPLKDATAESGAKWLEQHGYKSLAEAPKYIKGNAEDDKAIKNLNNQIQWLDFGDDTAWTNRKANKQLQVGSVYEKELMPGYIVKMTVKELKPFHATEIYKNRVAGTSHEASYKPNEENIFNQVTKNPFSTGIGGNPQTAYTHVKNAGLDTGSAKTTIAGTDDSGTGRDGQIVGVKFAIEATYNGKPVKPGIVMTSGEDIGSLETEIYTTNGTPWELAGVVGSTNGHTAMYKPHPNFNRLNEWDGNLNKWTSEELRNAIDGKMFATKDAATAGLGSQVFGGYTNGDSATPVVSTSNVTEVGFYIMSSGQQASMIGIKFSDFGDLPESYGTAEHFLRTQAKDYQTGQINQIQQPYLGTVKADIDSVSGTRVRGIDSDDTKEQGDEGVAQLIAPEDVHINKDNGEPEVKIVQAEDNTYRVKVIASANGNDNYNGTVGPAYVRGFIDFNGNGKFDEGEASEVVTVNGNQQTVELVFKNTQVIDTTKNAVNFRTRIATDRKQIEKPVGIAFSGEVEDNQIQVSIPPRGDKEETTGKQGETQSVGIEFISRAQGDDASDLGSNNGKTTFNSYGKQDYSEQGNSISLETTKKKQAEGVMIVDPSGNLVKSYTKAGQGTYTVTDDKVTFTPEASFVGKADGIVLRAADANGQSTGWTALTEQHGVENINEGSHTTATKTMDAVYIPTVTPKEITADPEESTDVQGKEQKKTPTFKTEGDSATPVTPSATYPAKLVDPKTGAKVDSVTVDGEGTYTIDPATGEVKFQPLPTFTGTASGVDVTLTAPVGQDKDGQPVTATATTKYTPTVTPVTPTADPATSAGVQGEAQKGTPTFTEGNNDVPIKDGSVKLLNPDGTEANGPVDALDPSGKKVGEYTVNPTTGEVTFTPTDKSYVGPVQPANVQAEDNNGTKVKTTYTPTIVGVTPTADPAKSVDIQGATQENTVSFEPGKTTIAGEEKTVEIDPSTYTLLGEDGQPATEVPAKDPEGNVIGKYTLKTVDGKAVAVFEPTNKTYSGEVQPVKIQAKDKNGTAVETTYTPLITPVTPTAEPAETTDIQGKEQTGKPTFTPGNPNVPMDDDTPATFEDGSKEKVVPGEGTYTVAPDGTVTFTPEKGFTGKGTGVTVKRVDKNGTPVTAKYTPTVTPVTPTAEPAETTDIQGKEQTGKPTFTPGNPDVPMDDDTPATFEDGSKEKVVPGEGTYTVAPDGTVTFTPEKNFTGKGTGVTVKRVDKNGTPVTAKYTPTVTPVTPTAEPVETTDIQGKEQTGKPEFKPGNPDVPMDDDTPATFEDGSKEKVVPGEGTYTVAPDGTVTFTPEKGFTGKGTGVTVKRVDKNGTPVTAKYTPTVTPVTPTAEPAETTDIQGKEQTGKPTFTPGNPNVPMDDDTPATFEDGSKEKVVPGEGTYTVAPDGTVTFTPEKGFTGKGTGVTVKRVDKNGTPVTAKYTPTVTPVTPTAEPAETTDIQGKEQTGKPTFTPGNPNVPMDDDTPATFEDGSKEKVVPGEGTYTVAPDGTVTFTPEKGFTGKGTGVTVKRVDKNGTPVTAKYTPTVTPVTPTAEPAETTDIQGKEQTGKPTFTPGNPDVPMDDDTPATFEDGSTEKKVPGEGTYTVAPDGTVTFTPEKNFTGKGTGVTVKRVDKNGTPVTAKYTPTVTPVTPTAEPVETTDIQGKEQTGKPEFKPGNPDVPMDDDTPATFEDGSTEKKVPGEGTYTVAPDGTVTFTPEKNFTGKGTGVTVKRVDKNGTPVTAKYTPTVAPVTPTGTDAVTEDVQGSTQTGKPVFTPGKTTVNGEEKTVEIDEDKPAKLVDPKTGDPVDSVTIEGEGTYTVAPDGTVTFTPEKNFTGKGTGVTVQREDKNGTPVKATYTPVVKPATPTSSDVITTNVQGATQSGTPTFEGGKVTVNGEEKTVEIDETVKPTFDDGTTEKKVPGEGTYTIDENGTVTFTPEKNFTGQATGVTVKRVDKNGTPITAKYTPVVVPVTPTSKDSESEGPKGQPQSGTPTFEGGKVTINGKEVPVEIDETVKPTFDDGTTEKKVPGEGTYTIDENGKVTFTPEPDFVGKATGVTVKRVDKNGTPVTATYTPTVRPDTSFVDKDGNPLSPTEDGTKPTKDIPGYKIVKTEIDEKGNTKHIYEKVKTSFKDKEGNEIPGNPSEDGDQPKKDIPGYRFVETKKLPNGDVEHVYEKVKTSFKDKEGNEIPGNPSEDGDQPKKDIPGYRFVETKKLPNGDVEHVYEKVKTSFKDKEGNEIPGNPSEDGDQPKKDIPGYRFVETKKLPNGDVEHVYEKVKTSFKDKEGNEIPGNPSEDGDQPKKDIPGYRFVETKKLPNGDVEHVYEKVKTSFKDKEGNEIPGNPSEDGDQPKKDIPGYRFVETKKLPNGDVEHVYEKVKTSFKDKEGNEIPGNPSEDGDQPKKDIPGYRFVETKKLPNGDVEHVYEKVKTSFKDKEGNEIPGNPSEDGDQPKKDIPGYRFVETKKLPNGDTEHVYEKVKTSFKDKEGNEIPGNPSEDGEQPKKDIPGYRFVETKKLPNGDVEHVYEKVTPPAPAPSPAPQPTPGKQTTTTWTDENGNPLKPTEPGSKEPGTIPGYEYVKTVTDPNGNIRHIFSKVQTPTPAPQPTPGKQTTTTWTDENGNPLKPTEPGSKEPGTIPGYEYVKTVTDPNGNIRHVFRKVAMPAPVEPSQPVQPANPAMPVQPAKPQVPATPAQPVQPTAVKAAEGKRELPNTGTEDNARLAALGLLGVLSGFGLVARKKKED